MGMKITGIDEAVSRLRDVGQRASDVRPAWPAVGDEIADEMDQQFDTAGASGGRPWKPLDPDYLQWKLSAGLDPETLVKSGELRRSLTSRPMGVEEYHDDHAEFGTSDPVAMFHQRGTRRGLPRRQTLFRTPRMTERINEALSRYITDGEVD